MLFLREGQSLNHFGERMMKRLIVVIASSFFAAGVSAADIYYGLGDGNSDLSTQRLSAEDFVGVQPSIGDSAERYQGWADGNPDLFKADRSGPSGAGSNPDIYGSFSENPDLQF
jgi:hypothetical protein